ncbi:MAG: alpha/beta hydrolase [Gammaproteobacteria bacterium]|nr:MAG: alpha/beta hydrolase [Gammaproteobacteria bacterium]
MKSMAEATVNGVRLVYEQRGEGTPLLMICGTGQTAAMWELGNLLTTIQDAGCSVATFDNRGIPPSECPEPPWTTGDMADDAIALIEHLEIGPCHLLGASLGANITQTVALKRPDLVRSAIFQVGGGNFTLAARLMLEGHLELMNQGIELPKALGQATMLDSALTAAQRQDDAMVEQILEVTAGLTSSFGPGGQQGQTGANVAWSKEDHVAELADMSVPCLVLAAEHDVFFPPANLKRVAETIPDARYVEIPGSAHITTDPAGAKVITDAVREFLSSQ